MIHIFTHVLGGGGTFEIFGSLNIGMKINPFKSTVRNVFTTTFCGLFLANFEISSFIFFWDIVFIEESSRKMLFAIYLALSPAAVIEIPLCVLMYIHVRVHDFTKNVLSACHDHLHTYMYMYTRTCVCSFMLFGSLFIQCTQAISQMTLPCGTSNIL